MRIHLTSVSRARKLAKALRALLACHHGTLVGHVQSQAAVAAMLGYGDWAELILVTLQRRGTPSPYDASVPEELQARIDFQARALARCTGLELEQAYLAVGRLRTTADPSRIESNCPFEYRGCTPEMIRMNFREGRFILVSHDGFRLAFSIMPSTNTKVFMSDDELDSSPELPAPSGVPEMKRFEIRWMDIVDNRLQVGR